MVKSRLKSILLVNCFFLVLSITIISFFFLQQKTFYKPNIYEIWWPGFNYSNEITHSDKEKYDEKNPRLRGNAQGIIDKLDYVKSLNVDYLWITPFFQSPQLDNGYDVADFYNVDNLFGVNSDFQQLLKRAHEKDLKILIDLVMNHTSWENPWFLWASGHSVSSSPFWKKEMYAKFIKNNNKQTFDDRFFSKYQKFYWIFEDNGKRDKDRDNVPIVKNPYKGKKWDPFNGKEEIQLPWWHQTGLNDNVGSNSSNSESLFFSTIKRRQDFSFSDIKISNSINPKNIIPYSKIRIKEKEYFYLHTFSDFQPDLNWHNPNVRKEMEKIANFYIKGEGWLKGEKVDGFRFDAIPLIGKTPKKNLLIPDPKLQDKFMGEFYQSTYKERQKKVDFFTIGELAQANENDQIAKKINFNFASKFFSTAYLPLDTLWNFKKDYIGNNYPVEMQIPSSKKDFAYFFNEFLADSFKQTSILNNNNSALIMENHDQPRSVSRFASSKYGNDPFFDNIDHNWEYYSPNSFRYFFHAPKDDIHTKIKKYVFPRAKALAAFKFLQPGISFIYAGQEYSHDNYPFYYEETKDTVLNLNFLKSIDLQVRSWVEKAYIGKMRLGWNQHIEEERVKKGIIIDTLAETGRDSARTLFQWSDENNAGWNKNIKFINTKRSKKNSYLKMIKNIEAKWLEKIRKKNINYNDQKYFTIFNDKRKLYKSSFLANTIVFGKTPDEIKKDSKINKWISNSSPPHLFIRDTMTYPLLLNPHYKDINVEDQEKNLDSPLNFYRRLLDIRKHNSILQQGNFKELKNGKDFQVENFNNLGSQIVASYTRGGKYLIVVNLDFIPYQVKIDLGKNLKKRILLNTHKKIEYNENNHFLNLEPYQGLLIKI